MVQLAQLMFCDLLLTRRFNFYLYSLNINNRLKNLSSFIFSKIKYLFRLFKLKSVAKLYAIQYIKGAGLRLKYRLTFSFLSEEKSPSTTFNFFFNVYKI